MKILLLILVPVLSPGNYMSQDGVYVVASFEEARTLTGSSDSIERMQVEPGFVWNGPIKPPPVLYEIDPIAVTIKEIPQHKWLNLGAKGE